MKTSIPIFLVFLCLSADGPKALAVSLPPDGGYRGGNIAALVSGLAKVSAQLQPSKPATQTALNDQ